MLIWTDATTPVPIPKRKKAKNPPDHTIVESIKGVSWPFFNTNVGLISDSTCGQI